MTTELNDEMVIIELPFTGNAQNFVKDGLVSMGLNKGATFGEYCKQRPESKFELVSWDKFNELHEKHFERPFTECTEEQFDDALECLPPLKLHWINQRYNVFYLGECYSGLFYSLYIFDKVTGKYYSGLKKITLTDPQIVDIYEREILNKTTPGV
jgi:hypothetical protein